MEDYKMYQGTIIKLVRRIKDIKKLERIYKLVQYLYMHSG